MKFLILLTILSTSVAGWAFLKYADAYTNLEECAVEEMLHRSERDNLMALPAILKTTDRSGLIERLKKDFPNTLVESKDEGICWGRLLLRFDINGRIEDIKEGC